MWTFLPAMMANQAPLLARDLPLLDVPVDGGRTWRDGNRLLGAHKTVRGLVVGVIAGAATAIVQAYVAVPSRYITAPVVRPLVLGCALGAGALLGDLAGSFLKRRCGVASGDDWFPVDQLDAAAGALAGLWLLAPVPVELALCFLVLAIPLHVGANRVASRHGWNGAGDNVFTPRT